MSGHERRGLGSQPRLAEALWSPYPSWLTKLCRQAGVEHAIGGLPEASSGANGERPWDYLPLLRWKEHLVVGDGR
jgi:hypothetical protein